jgi:hypothetical protein
LCVSSQRDAYPEDSTADFMGLNGGIVGEWCSGKKKIGKK